MTAYYHIVVASVKLKYLIRISHETSANVPSFVSDDGISQVNTPTNILKTITRSVQGFSSHHYLSCPHIDLPGRPSVWCEPSRPLGEKGIIVFPAGLTQLNERRLPGGRLSNTRGQPQGCLRDQETRARARRERETAREGEERVNTRTP